MAYSPTLTIDDLTPEYLKANYLVGLTLCGADNQELPSTFFTEQLAIAIGKLEDITNVDFIMRTNLAESHDYHSADYIQYGYMKLYRVPTHSVQEVRMVYPTGTSVVIFPSNWVRVHLESSQLNIIPNAGSLSHIVLGMGGQYLPLLQSQNSYVPHLWQVDYKSGFDDAKIPRMIVDAVMKMASMEILTIMSDLVGPIGQSSTSLSVDGLSQSVSRQLPAFKARIDSYAAALGLAPGSEARGLIAQIRATYTGVPMVSM
jgi:hypothetical protein